MGKKVTWVLKKLRASSLLQLTLLFSTVTFMVGAVMFFLELERNSDQFGSVLDGIWWAIVTFSTTGYGDKVPITLTGRAVATLGIFFGIAATSALSGALASIFVDRNTRSRRGLMDFPKLRNHYIICGWKDHMADILQDILETDGQLSSDDLLIISNVDGEKVQELKEIHALGDLRFVRGDYFSEAALIRANVKFARKVIVLSDTFDSKAISEVDSKTVMTVLTVKALSKDVYVCAELLDRKYEGYLKQAMCDEILFSRDLSRRMIANTTATSGMAHIMGALLSGAADNGSRLNTLPIPDRYVGTTYGDLKTAEYTGSRKVLLGILENTGSPNQIKMAALREAQKTSDTSALVMNLQAVKELEINNPVFIPSDDYQIQKFSKAIVLERVAEA